MDLSPALAFALLVVVALTALLAGAESRDGFADGDMTPPRH